MISVSPSDAYRPRPLLSAVVALLVLGAVVATLVLLFRARRPSRGTVVAAHPLEGQRLLVVSRASDEPRTVLSAIDTTSGRAVWEHTRAAKTSIVVRGATVLGVENVPGAARATVLALDPATGQVRWQTTVEDIVSRVTVHGATISVRLLGGGDSETSPVIGLAAADGRRLFTTEPVPSFYDPVAFSHWLLFPTRHVTHPPLLAVDVRTGDSRKLPGGLHWPGDTSGERYASIDVGASGGELVSERVLRELFPHGMGVPRDAGDEPNVEQALRDRVSHGRVLTPDAGDAGDETSAERAPGERPSQLAGTAHAPSLVELSPETLAPRPVQRKGETVVPPARCADPALLARGRARLLCSEHDPQSRWIVRALWSAATDGADPAARRLTVPENQRLVTSSADWLEPDREQSPWRGLELRFVPVEVLPEHAEQPMRLCLLDLDAMTLPWCSHPVPGALFRGPTLARRWGRTALVWMTLSDGEQAAIVFDGDTARCRGAVSLRPAGRSGPRVFPRELELAPAPAQSPGDEVLVGVALERAFAFDLRAMRLRFQFPTAAPALEAVDQTSTVEATLGPMPR